MILTLAIIFIAGYYFIATESSNGINKAAISLLTGVLCWTVYIVFSGHPADTVNNELQEHLGNISGILFFIMAAMTIVELIDSHDGFEIVTSAIRTRNKAKLLFLVSIITFILSSLLDNLTTAVVMVSIVRKLVVNREERFLFIGMIVIAANAGGAWSPIGDITTTMLWIGGQVSAFNIIRELILPSLVCMLIPMILMMNKLKGELPAIELQPGNYNTTLRERRLIFYCGLVGLMFVPVFKTLTQLPPYMGILLSLGMIWLITEILHRNKANDEKDRYSVVSALQRIDVSSVLFFFGILLAISALESVGILKQISFWLDDKFGNLNLIVISIGLLSAIVDNVPLVAATMGMYDLSLYPKDNYLWELLAYCTGTGGSILIIGSAAGVAAMGIEKIDFFNYFKKISLYALIGYFAGALTYILMHNLK